jgi:hypothetical protein
MLKEIIKAGLLAGTLDITAACVNAYASRKIMPGEVLKYVASGVFGKAAFEGGYGMMLMGLLFHFIIAFACTAVFFLLYPKIKFLRYSHVLNSLLIALIAWAVTTQVIMPMSNVPKGGSFDITRAAIAVGILFICIGMPISILARKCFGMIGINEIRAK